MASAPPPGQIQTPIPSPPPPTGGNGPKAPNAQTGCLSGTDSGETINGNIGGTPHNPWAGVLLVTIGSQKNVPAFCIDLVNSIRLGDCFNSGGPTSPQVTYILNKYPPLSGNVLTDAEAAARQAAVWWYTDNFTTTSPSAVRTRAIQIIGDTDANCASTSLAQVPQLSIAPASAVNFLPSAPDRQFVLTATRGSSPLANQLIDLATSYGTLSAAHVTTNLSGQATFTVTSNVPGAASITASFAYTLPVGTIFNAVVANKQQLVLGSTTPGKVFSSASVQWKNAPTAVTLSQFAARRVEPENPVDAMLVLTGVVVLGGLLLIGIQRVRC
jgi:hypothetical protein